MLDAKPLIDSLSELDLQDLKDGHLQQIFSINKLLADVAMMADHSIDIQEYNGVTWALRDLIHQYELADKKLKNIAEKRRDQIKQVRL
ncbi:hypothetical protein [Alteromonas lipotrueiana]|uniref:hypothetical protein n=1 Tax=Alteromonas lipotrueiana TaxID=2803815 RepID=UPI001C448A59|nr:hypothetical protein [Alteromonas lipotrueiana]